MNYLLCTCASVRPSVAASCLLSGLVIYFWSWNLFSRPLRCRLENTALDQDLLRLFVPPLFVEPPHLSDVDIWIPSVTNTTKQNKFLLHMLETLNLLYNIMTKSVTYTSLESHNGQLWFFFLHLTSKQQDSIIKRLALSSHHVHLMTNSLTTLIFLNQVAPQFSSFQIETIQKNFQDKCQESNIN